MKGGHAQWNDYHGWKAKWSFFLEPGIMVQIKVGMTGGHSGIMMLDGY
jgi:hypothetical protein